MGNAITDDTIIGPAIPKAQHCETHGYYYGEQCSGCAIAELFANGEAAPAQQQSALDIQVGGSHYKSLAIQPAVYCHKNRIGKLEGDVIAYVTRWRQKNGIQDLEKARHTLDLIIEMEEAEAK